VPERGRLVPGILQGAQVRPHFDRGSVHFCRGIERVCQGFETVATSSELER